MSDDIVERLRVLTGTLLLGDFQGFAATTASAADEIERLRAGGCARDQRTTQFCAEAVTLQREVERLRQLSGDAGQLRHERDGYLDGNRMALKALSEANEIAKRYKAERDDARWHACITWAWLYRPSENAETEARKEAKRRGWDCFKGVQQ